MALFKILQGKSTNFKTENLGDPDLKPAFNEGFCYFLTDTKLFYVDFITENESGVKIRHREPLNAADALSLVGCEVNNNELNYSKNEIPTSNVVKETLYNNLPRLTHIYSKETGKTEDGKSSIFDFSALLPAIPAKFYLVFFNGLLLIQDIHYTISGGVITLKGWTATEDDYIQIVGYKPIEPTLYD